MAKLHFYYSAMNAGKSTTLLQSSHNYNERGMETLLFAPNIDTRFQPGHISTRIGLNAKATVFFEKTDLYEIIHEVITKNNDIQCVLIDEAQFLKKAQVEQLCRVVDELKIPALTYGLRTDFQGEPFEGSQYLLAWADLLIELKTICHCGHKATMNLRIDQDGNPLNTGEQIQIGGNESYEATCRHHFRLGQSGKRQLKMQLKKNDH